MHLLSFISRCSATLVLAVNKGMMSCHCIALGFVAILANDHAMNTIIGTPEFMDL